MKSNARARHRRPNSDEGSILTLGIGLAILVLLLVTVSVNMSVAWSRKLTLQNIADGAALAAAQGVDFTSVYRGELDRGIRLDPKLARQHVEKYLHQVTDQNKLSNLKLVELTVHGASAQVEISSCLCLPFTYLPFDNGNVIKVRASAKQFFSK
ncbi:MAG: hypothetical protein KGQ38_06670 [Actinomycetales bacterium]|nr:hypothetical protein [Actinomycetales bacterium]